MKRALRAAVAAGMFLAAIPFVMTVAMQANAPTASSRSRSDRHRHRGPGHAAEPEGGRQPFALVSRPDID
jgi:hypothetical protein